MFKLPRKYDNMGSMKKKVIAYLHTHWDREWYHNKEEFNLRLIEVFDEVLEELEVGRAPSFYFDGQVCALKDYLKFRPEALGRVKKFIEAGKLFIGPFFVSADSFLCSGKSMEKNLEMGLEFSRTLGQKEFLGYLPDTFGHSREIPDILKKFGINNVIVWRGTGNIKADFVFNGLNCTRLVEGYFIDTLHSEASEEKQAQALEGLLDKIAKYSGDVLLLPLGADHLRILPDASKKITRINKHLKNYEIELSTPFEYFKRAKFGAKHDGEFLDNSANYTLPGVYSSRVGQKVLNAKLQWELNEIVAPLDKLTGEKWAPSLKFAAEELIKNQAHDSIYGCSTDEVHRQVGARFERVEQILNGVKKRIMLHAVDEKGVAINLSNEPYSGVIKFKSAKKFKNAQIIGTERGFEDELFYDKSKIPITEDFKPIYEQIAEVKNLAPKEFSEILPVAPKKNRLISAKVKGNEILINGVKITLTDVKDQGDSYNFSPASEPKTLPIIKTKLVEDGDIRSVLRVYFSGATLDIAIYNNSNGAEFEARINNKKKNHKIQVNFELQKPVAQTIAEDLITETMREHDPNYSLFKAQPAKRPEELKTNSFPLQRYVFAQGLGVFTKGLNEYEICKNRLSITLLRATGVISNPKNPARSIPAGPPIPTPELQCLGEYTLNFAINFDAATIEKRKKIADDFYGLVVTGA